MLLFSSYLNLGDTTMSSFLRLIKWFWKAWPVIVFVPLICIHFVLLDNFPKDIVAINKFISLLTQLIGGLLILYSIDSNIGIIKQKSLIALLTTYLKEFPLFNKPIILEVQGISQATSICKARITVGRNPQSIEEKIQYLQDQINEIRCCLEQDIKDINEKIDRKSKEMGVQIQETKSALRNLESKIDEVSAGGIKIQLFGVLLMVYGAITNYVA